MMMLPTEKYQPNTPVASLGLQRPNRTITHLVQRRYESGIILKGLVA
jgi:hypothetical protein